MRLFWTVLFALAAIFTVGAFVYAPIDLDWWLPNTVVKLGGSFENPQDQITVTKPISTAGGEIDFLFVVILWLTGIVFIGVEIVFLMSIWKFADSPNHKATLYTHGSKKLELIWTIIPAFILIWIAVYQLGAWADIKYRTHAPNVAPLAEVTARQFQWVSRYPGDDKKLGTNDDIVTVNDFHFYVEPGENGESRPIDTMIYLKSADVLHSFYLPQLRVKQDAVPGLTIPVWFNANQPGHYELVCAELCGWGHYKMRGKVTIHQSKAEFDKWLEERKAEQSFDGVTKPQAKPAAPAPAQAQTTADQTSAQGQVASAASSAGQGGK